MGCAHNKNQDGFTLVEIAIVMIIIGLLIGGTFSGMKLIENMQVNKTVQDLKSIQSAGLTFKDTYGRLPGDISNPATRLSNCTTAPCATGGNGNRMIGLANLWAGVIANTDENFTFWHHLAAADLLSMGIKNTMDMSFGEGQPDAPIGGGYRISNLTGAVGWCPSNNYSGSLVALTGVESANSGTGNSISCAMLLSLDRKIDNGRPTDGLILSGWGCEDAAACNANYLITGSGIAFYDLQGF